MTIMNCIYRRNLSLVNRTNTLDIGTYYYVVNWLLRT